MSNTHHLSLVFSITCVCVKDLTNSKTGQKAAGIRAANKAINLNKSNMWHTQREKRSTYSNYSLSPRPLSLREPKKETSCFLNYILEEQKKMYSIFLTVGLMQIIFLRGVVVGGDWKRYYYEGLSALLCLNLCIYKFWFCSLIAGKKIFRWLEWSWRN
jgi:hypothetical protein